MQTLIKPLNEYITVPYNNGSFAVYDQYNGLGVEVNKDGTLKRDEDGFTTYVNVVL